MPALAAAEAGKVIRPRAKACATKDDTPIIRPLVPALISHGLAAVASSKKAVVMEARLASQAARSTSPIGRRSAKPALLTTMSSRPKRAAVSSTRRMPTPGCARSPSRISVSAPASRAAAATFSAPARFFRACRAMAMPGAESARTVAAPIPEEEPVTRATRAMEANGDPAKKKRCAETYTARFAPQGFGRQASSSSVAAPGWSACRPGSVEMHRAG